MKQKNFLKIAMTLFLATTAINSFGQVFITEIADPNDNGSARYVELFNQGEDPVDLSDWALRRWTNNSATPQSDVSLSGTIASKGFIIFAASSASFSTSFPSYSGTLVQLGAGGPVDSNGDDNIALINNTGTLVDMFGVAGEDGTGTCHEFEDGRAERKANVLAAKSTWSEADWNVWADSTISGCTSHSNDPQNVADGFDPGLWIGVAASPGITLGVVSGDTTESGTTATFTVVLNAQPATNVVLNLSSADVTEITLDKATLTFTNGDWDSPQTVTATGLDDAIQDGNQDVTITVSVDVSASDGDYAAVADVTTTITNEDDDFQKIIISEIMYNTPTAYGSDDEWIELYNANGSSVDISGWTLEYNSITFTFPGSTTLGNGSYIVISVGSNGDGTFNGDNPFTPDFNNLSVTNELVADTDNTNNLTNSSRTIELKNGSTTIDIVTYSTSDISDTNGNGSSFEVIDTSAANSATSANWQASAINGGSPKRISGTNWTGASSSDWLAGNFSNELPTSTSDVSIPAGLTFYPTVSSAITVNAINIESGATLIATNTFTGSVNYNRTLANGSQWYLMSSPVVGETYDNTWVTNNSIPSSTLDIDNRGVGWYDNSSSDTDTDGAVTSDSATGFWRYMEGGSSNPFAVGRGYSIIRSGSGSVSFVGTGVYTSNQTFTLTQGDNNFNLIGNPFTAFITLGTFHTTNTANIGTDFYFWNGSSYDTRTSGLNPTFEIAPGQGFFVEASNTNNVTFEISDASHQGTETFQKTPNTRPEITLSITENSNSRYAKVFYIDGTTQGFDSGYDGKLFGGISHSFAIYSDLIESDGKKYQIQSLPNSNYENMVIPFGITADAGKEITFTAEALNLPSELKVFLEDRQTNSYTRLDETNANYKVTLTEALNGIGRFYLHTASKSTLNTNSTDLKTISIYKTTNSNLRIVGLSQGKATVKLFNILGKQVLNTTFTSNGVQDISLPNLATGIYIVQLENEAGKLNKKITLE
jgi:hypothetical protein